MKKKKVPLQGVRSDLCIGCRGRLARVILSIPQPLAPPQVLRRCFQLLLPPLRRDLTLRMLVSFLRTKLIPKAALYNEIRFKMIKHFGSCAAASSCCCRRCG